MVEGTCHGKLEEVAVRLSDKLVLVEYMAAGNGKLGQKWHEYLSHFYLFLVR